MLVRLYPEEYDRLIAIAKSHGLAKLRCSPVTAMLEAIASGKVLVKLTEKTDFRRGGSKTLFRLTPEGETNLRAVCLLLGLTYGDNKPGLSALLKLLAEGQATLIPPQEQK